MIDETCLRGNRPLSLRPERRSAGLPSDAKLMDQSNDLQPKESSHEASDDLSVADRRLHLPEVNGPLQFVTFGIEDHAFEHPEVFR